MKRIITIILCLLFLTGCSKEEELSFEGVVVAVEPIKYSLGIIIENSDK